MKSVIKRTSAAKFSIVFFVLMAVIMTVLMMQIGNGVAGPISATDESKVPHYFGPYPNWANSPQVLADATVTLSAAAPQSGSVGNPLTARPFATDTTADVFVIDTNAPLPAGSLSAFQTWAQSGSGPSTFKAYVLRPTGVAGEYTVIFDSGPLTVSGTATGIQTFTLPTAVVVQNGDLIAHYGQGIPLDASGGSDTTMSPVTPAPTLNQIFTVGTTYPVADIIRTYSFAATVTPSVLDPGTGATATATVDPITGAISDIVITNPGSGYLTPPNVAITSGVTPTTPAAATAVISLGVINSIAVAESGFGFTTPSVAITGGNPTAGSEAMAQASGGVDNVNLSSGGAGYTALQPLVEFSLPDLPELAGGTRATGTATMLNGAVTGVTVVNPGSGYTSAPTITIWNGDLNQPASTPATATATIGIGQIDLISGGQGYDSVPTVTITDTGGIDRGASATANVAVRGAVTAINFTNHGAGYLTPGLKKFVDPLPGLCSPVVAGSCPTDPAAKAIPLGVPDTTTYSVANGFADSDTYEIALVQYRMKFSSLLPGPGSLLRGYVQLETPANASISQHYQLVNQLMDGTSEPVLINGQQAYGVTRPQYLGPTIVASKNKPVRIIFHNELPTGSDGNLFLPVDNTMMGAGMGPDMNGMLPTNLNTVLDEVRNPMCGELDANGEKPMGCFTDNRATLHLHGGTTPWISDGTAHQWITPQGQTAAYPEGVSVENVPDMNVCNADDDGCQTFYYTNQQSARLLFYHDHAWGITRLNVYAGEAAGYLITDPTEQTLIGTGGALNGLGVGTPLVIQDKTFVPSAAKIAQQDPTWDYTRWGGEGNLWYHHVYMPAQNPGDAGGMSAFGRWMYGPWFWPPATDAVYGPIPNPYYIADCDPNTAEFCEPALIPGTPNISVGMEQFNDTPIVNGTAYPTVTVDPKAYRYRVLNAANDRFWNLSWYVADPTTGTLSEVALNPAELAAAQTDPVVVATPDTSKSPAGPNWIMIGSEGGFLPTPVVLPAQPTTWITDPTRFDVGNVDEHSLLLAPAERADVIVDFSQYRGKTLILYNDAPAAFPARVPGYDYYTGGPDMSPAGAPTTLPGYGPNTRTIMQVKVSNAGPAVAFDRPNTTADRLGALMTAFGHKADGSGVFESGQHPIIVGQAAYNSAYGTDFVASGWCNSSTTPSARCDGYARIAEGAQPGDLFGFNTLAAPTAKMQIPIQPKGIHDEMNSASFDEFGRMTANMGLEAPGATPLLQNIILYPFVNPVTEIIDATNLPSAGIEVTPISNAADGTQIWKITHNGVDTHPIHWHLYDVQVINRVSWDNIIIPPDPTELGWKDTVRISPLEDTYVALRPIMPSVPWELPNSIRPLNPMMPLASEMGFNNTDANGDPTDDDPITNDLTNFGWEYTWHCHILSHEEMDMMRPQAVAVPPKAPTGLTLNIQGGIAKLAWNDNSIAETSYVVQRKDASNNWIDKATIQSPLDVANTTGSRSYDDTTYQTNSTYPYRIVAKNTVGYGGAGGAFMQKTVQSMSAEVGPAGAPPSVTITAPNTAGPFAQGSHVPVTWNVANSPVGGWWQVYAFDGSNHYVASVANTGAASYNYDWTVSQAVGSGYVIRIWYMDAGGIWHFFNESDPAFAISAGVVPSITITAPNTAGPFTQGSHVPVTWNVANSPVGGWWQVYAFDGSYHYLASVANTGAASYNYDWIVNQAVGTYTIRIWYMDAGGIWHFFNESDPAFAIQ